MKRATLFTILIAPSYTVNMGKHVFKYLRNGTIDHLLGL